MFVINERKDMWENFGKNEFSTARDILNFAKETLNKGGVVYVERLTKKFEFTNIEKFEEWESIFRKIIEHFLING
ncbi:MAG: hypothetical protein WAK96_12405 [Desulfobaccales bacterium]